MRGIEAQFLALQKGFNELIPQHLLKPFDQKELEVGRAGWSLPPGLATGALGGPESSSSISQGGPWLPLTQRPPA